MPKKKDKKPVETIANPITIHIECNAEIFRAYVNFYPPEVRDANIQYFMREKNIDQDYIRVNFGSNFLFMFYDIQNLIESYRSTNTEQIDNLIRNIIIQNSGGEENIDNFLEVETQKIFDIDKEIGYFVLSVILENIKKYIAPVILLQNKFMHILYPVSEINEMTKKLERNDLNILKNKALKEDKQKINKELLAFYYYIFEQELNESLTPIYKKFISIFSSIKYWKYKNFPIKKLINKIESYKKEYSYNQYTKTLIEFFLLAARSGYSDLVNYIIEQGLILQTSKTSLYELFDTAVFSTANEVSLSILKSILLINPLPEFIRTRLESSERYIHIIDNFLKNYIENTFIYDHKLTTNEEQVNLNDGQNDLIFSLVYYIAYHEHLVKIGQNNYLLDLQKKNYLCLTLLNNILSHKLFSDHPNLRLLAFQLFSPYFPKILKEITIEKKSSKKKKPNDNYHKKQLEIFLQNFNNLDSNEDTKKILDEITKILEPSLKLSSNNTSNLANEVEKETSENYYKEDLSLNTEEKIPEINNIIRKDIEYDEYMITQDDLNILSEYNEDLYRIVDELNEELNFWNLRYTEVKNTINQLERKIKLLEQPLDYLYVYRVAMIDQIQSFHVYNPSQTQEYQQTTNIEQINFSYELPIEQTSFSIQEDFDRLENINNILYKHSKLTIEKIEELRKEYLDLKESIPILLSKYNQMILDQPKYVLVLENVIHKQETSNNEEKSNSNDNNGSEANQRRSNRESNLSDGLINEEFELRSSNKSIYNFKIIDTKLKDPEVSDPRNKEYLYSKEEIGKRHEDSRVTIQKHNITEADEQLDKYPWKNSHYPSIEFFGSVELPNDINQNQGLIELQIL